LGNVMVTKKFYTKLDTRNWYDKLCYYNIWIRRIS
jgi:hypothetical protein